MSGILIGIHASGALFAGACAAAAAFKEYAAHDATRPQKVAALYAYAAVVVGVVANYLPSA